VQHEGQQPLNVRVAPRPCLPAGHAITGARAGLAARAIAAVLIAVAAVAPCSAHASAALTGFLSAPTDQLGVPGMQADGEITPEGDLYTGWAEYEWRWGTGLRAWDQPTRTLPDPSLPLFTDALAQGPVTYRQTMFAVPVAGRPIVYATITASNSTDRPREARVGLEVAYTKGRQILGVHGLETGAYRFERPLEGQQSGLYEQLGQGFSPSFAYSFVGRDLDRSGLLLARGPAAPSQTLPTSASDTPTAPHAGRVFTLRLAPGASAALTWQIPLSPPPAGGEADATLDALARSNAQAALRALWARQEAGMMSIEVPEARVGAAYRAAIVQILDSRYLGPAGWVQMVNRLQYAAFWIRDAAMEAQALDLAGLHAPAQQDLEFMDRFQQPDGLFISRAGQYDGLGEALWAIARHAQLSESAAFARAQLPRIEAALQWLSLSSSLDPLGLLPVGDPGDDELATGHITGDDLWAAAGLRSAVAAAELAGEETLAQAWQRLDSRFEQSLDATLDAAVARAGHIPPVLDNGTGQDWGNYYAAYPLQVLPAPSAAVGATVAWARRHSVQGLPTYDDGTSLHDYLGFAIFQTELERGERAQALAGLYAELAHTTATDQGWEWDIAPFGYRGSPVDMAPHGTFSADYVALLRDLLVQEEPDGAIVLLDGASPAWLSAGQRIVVSDAATDRGVVSFVERSWRGGESLRWHGALSPGSVLVWRLPWWAHDVRDAAGHAPAGGTVALRGSDGEVRVSFSGRAPRESYAAAVSRLDREYRVRGHAAPLVGASP
jgi:hypothetical protein